MEKIISDQLCFPIFMNLEARVAPWSPLLVWSVVFKHRIISILFCCKGCKAYEDIRELELGLLLNI